MSRRSYNERSHSLDLEFQDQPNSGEEFLIDIPEPDEVVVGEDLTKERKLANLRQQIVRKQEKKKQSIIEPQLRGKDFYLRKVSSFLFASFFLSLASQQFFVYVYMHDFISAYFDHNVTMFGGTMEGTNYIYLNYFVANFFGYLVSACCIINQVQEDEEFGRKVFSLSLIVSAMSIFVSTKLMPQKNYAIFCFFYTAIPSFLTGRLGLNFKRASDSSSCLIFRK
jgi:hypothetical protein